MENNHKINEILRALYQAKDQSYGIFCHAQKRAKDFLNYGRDKANDLIEKEQQFEVFASEITKKCAEHYTNSTIHLISLISKLSEKELIELVSATDEEYEKWENDTEYDLLDDFSLKIEAFKYIINPSVNILKAHQMHKEMMDKN